MTAIKRYKVGIDVGGTNTDCALLEIGRENEPGRGIVGWHKTRTTPNVTDGIASALQTVLTESGIHRDDILSIAIGTTHFINAIIESDPRRLSKVAVLRLGAPYTAQCPPFVDFPAHLKRIMHGHDALLDGGLQIDGSEIRPINKKQLRAECQVIKAKGLTNIVLVGVFSPLAAEGTQEHLAREIIIEELGPNVNVVCSSKVGPIGLIERENAAILNCSILTFARRTVKRYYDVLDRLGVKCNLYLTQLDGTLLAANLAAEYPIRTFVNGPTNSMRGASFLAGMDAGKHKSSVIVVDIGGTTSDVGVLLPSGFPRKAAAFTEVGGVRTNFSMPDIYSTGLGGGSRVRLEEDRATVGPDSVGNEIESEGIIFGGKVLTVTDVAVAAGLTNNIGDPTLIKNFISLKEIALVQSEVRRILENAIDRMKTDTQDITLLLVGGGSIIIPSQLRGVKEIIRPPYFSVANAVGAAIGRVLGEVDKVVVFQGKDYDVELEKCKKEAIGKAVESGAEEGSVSIAEVSVVQLPYVSNNASRVMIKASGELSSQASRQTMDNRPSMIDEPEPEAVREDNHQLTEEATNEPIDIEAYKPNITKDKEWLVSETDLAWIAEGCAVLGCGGGGAPYPAYITVREILRKGGRVRVVDLSYFSSKASEEKEVMILPVGFMGSPSVSSERIPAGNEIPRASEALMKFCGIGRPGASGGLGGIVSTEIGGKNGVEPMKLASSEYFDVPLLDGDLMGRAYPRMNQIVPCVYSDKGLAPVAAADAVGNCVIIPSTVNNEMVETLLRSICTDLGSALGVAMRPMSISEFEKCGLSGSTSFAWWVGRAIEFCRRERVRDIPRALMEVQDGRVLFVGKIIDVKREVRGGFTWGTLTIAPLLQDEIEDSEASESSALHLNSNPSTATTNSSGTLIVPFQNENLCARLITSPGAQPEVICSVPDLIAVLDSQSGASIGTQDYRYGLRVTVVGLVGNPKWQTEEGLRVGGPEAFGMDFEYKAIGKFREVPSVIDTYAF